MRFLSKWPFFIRTIEVDIFCLRGWCMLGVILLPAFTQIEHECQDLLSSCDGMHVCTDWTSVYECRNQSSPLLSVLWSSLWVGEVEACALFDIACPYLTCFHLPSSVPCRIVFVRPELFVTWPYHFSFLLLSAISRYMCGPRAWGPLILTSLFVMCSLHEIPRSCQ